MKIRIRLTLQFFLVVATILIFSMLFVYSRFKRITDNEYYNNLKTKAHMTAEMVLHEGDLEKIEDITPQKGTEGLPISDNVIIFNSKNEKVFSFNRNRKDGIPFNLLEFSKSENTYRQGDIYYYGLPFTTSKGSKYYVVASSFFNSKELMDLRQIIFLAIVLGLIFVAVSGFFYTRQALNPLFSMVLTCLSWKEGWNHPNQKMKSNTSYHLSTICFQRSKTLLPFKSCLSAMYPMNLRILSLWCFLR